MLAASRLLTHGSPIALVGLAAATLAGCLIDEYCFVDADCESGLACAGTTGQCVQHSCRSTPECNLGYVCHAGTCLLRSTKPLLCPSEMADIDGVFCMDRYEASRPDATDTSLGIDDSRATSRQGAIPWQVTSIGAALAACVAAEKDLCTPLEWQGACQGSPPRIYPYGNVYSATTCNGVDRFCACGRDSPCAGQQPCPFPGCAQVCGTDPRLLPTGTSQSCRSQHGVFDLAGNLSEVTQGAGQTSIRGGGFFDRVSETAHRCDSAGGSLQPDTTGFRCCRRPGEDTE